MDNAKLGEGCFRNCTSLTSVTFPTSLNNIPAKAYEGCTALEDPHQHHPILFLEAKVFMESGQDTIAGDNYILLFYSNTNPKVSVLTKGK